MPTPTISWAVDADGDWSDTADWNPARLPDAADDVAINTTDLHTVTHSVGADTVHSLAVGNDDFVVTGGSLTITSAASFANLLTVSGGDLSFGKAGSATATSFDQSGGTVSGAGTLTVTGAAAFSGVSTETGTGETLLEGSTNLAAGATLNLAGGRVLTLTGTGSTLAGSVTGLGTLDFVGGTQTLRNGIDLGVSNWMVSGGTTVRVGANLTYVHGFIQNAATINLFGHTLTLSGAVAFDGATVGGGSLVTRGATTISSAGPYGLFLGSAGGPATWTNTGTVNDTVEINYDARGGGAVKIINTSTGVFDFINTSQTVLFVPRFINDGLLEKTAGAGGVSVGPIVNNGTIEVFTGGLGFGVVSGNGAWIIAGGELDFIDFNSRANVTFSGTSGILLASRSRSDTLTVSGFSTTGGTTLDLQDIRFVSAGEATYSGTASGGTLTVTDGTHTAHITFVGNYLAATFTCSPDGIGDGGTNVVATTAHEAAPVVAAVNRFAAATAAFAAPPAASASAHGGDWDHAAILAAPAGHGGRAAIA